MSTKNKALSHAKGKRPIIDTKDISPSGFYPLKEAVKYIHMAYNTATNQINDGTFPLPYKRQHARLILIRGSDIIKFLEGGTWVLPKEPEFRRVG